MPRSRKPLLTSSLLIALLAAVGAEAAPLDPRQRDAATAACMDFYQHANGGWLSSTPVPAGLPSFGYTDELRAGIALQQRALLRAFAEQPADALEASIARLYALGLDQAGVDALGLGPAQPFLAKIDALEKPRELPALLAELHGWGAPILFSFSAGADLQQPQRQIAYLNQGGLGLPDRDYYLREDAPTLELREAYRGYVQQLLSLAGRSDAAAESARVLAIEIELARASLSLEQLRDPRNSYRPTALRGLDRRQPNLRWRDYLKAAGLRRLDSVSQAHIAFFDALNARFASLPLTDWQTYLRFHVLHAAAPFLGNAFSDAHAQLYVRTLAGREPLPREAQVIGFIERSLGEALGQRYAARHVEPARREAALALAEGLRSQLRASVEGASWLSAEGRQALIADIDSLVIALGGPASSEWQGFELKAQNYPEAVLALARARHARELARIGGDTPPRWPISPTSLLPAYDNASHTLYVPAGLLQSPQFEPAGDAALNHGAVGVLIARGLLQAFDPVSGARRGLLSEADRQAWAERGRPLVAQYSAFAALGAQTVDGAATWAENRLDLGALQLAYTGFLAAGGERGDAVEGLSPAQRFFHAWARHLRRNYQDDALRLLLISDTRAPARFRVNGPLPHLSAFHAAFECKEGQGMFLPEPARAQVF